jgi:REP element-mobilizing transposase RayT
LLLDELKRLATHTAVGVAGFAVMDNHVHLLLKVDVQGARKWSAREVARRWLALHPPRNGHYKPLNVTDEHIGTFAKDANAVMKAREKLASISQFMKEFKQQVTQRLNALDDTTGPLWAGRFKCKAVTSEAQLLTTLAYIDLNPFAAGVCDEPEQAEHTTLAARLRGEAAGTTQDTTQDTATDATTTQDRPGTGRLARGVERPGWWLSLEPSRQTHRVLPRTDLTLATYRRLLARTARLLRPGKRRLRAADTTPVHQRVPVTPAALAATLRAWLTDGLPWARLPAVWPAEV